MILLKKIPKERQRTCYRVSPALWFTSAIKQYNIIKETDSNFIIEGEGVIEGTYKVDKATMMIENSMDYICLSLEEAQERRLQMLKERIERNKQIILDRQSENILIEDLLKESGVIQLHK